MKVYLQYVLMFMMYFFSYETDENIVNICLKKPFKLQRANEILMENRTICLKNLTKIK